MTLGAKATLPKPEFPLFSLRSVWQQREQAHSGTTTAA